MAYEDVPCVICGGNERQVIYPARPRAGDDPPHDFGLIYRASGDELLRDPLVKCPECDFYFVSPRPAAGILLESYAAGEDPTYASQLEAREQTFDRALSRIERLLPERGSVLDVGTAAGAFLAVAQRRGWVVHGCEPNLWLAALGTDRYGIPIEPGDLSRQKYSPGSFDLITLWDVIEHTPDPKAVIARCRELLKPGGLLVINFPDIGSTPARALGRLWPFLSSVHLYYFDRRTIGRLLEADGFHIELLRPHVQWLELGYLIERASIVNGRLARAGRALARVLGLERLHVPYWLGQTFVAARRSLSTWLLPWWIYTALDCLN